MALPETRWIQRFDNFKKALGHLEHLVIKANSETATMYDEALVVKYFEMTYELSWNLLKDYLEWQGATDKAGGSRDTFRLAFSLGYITDGELWTKMIEDRNKATHIYDEEVAIYVSNGVSDLYIDKFRELKDTFEKILRELK